MYSNTKIVFENWIIGVILKSIPIMLLNYTVNMANFERFWDIPFNNTFVLNSAQHLSWYRLVSR